MKHSTKKGTESKAGKLKIHGGFKSMDEKMGGKKEHESKKDRKK